MSSEPRQEEIDAVFHKIRTMPLINIGRVIEIEDSDDDDDCMTIIDHLLDEDILSSAIDKKLEKEEKLNKENDEKDLENEKKQDEENECDKDKENESAKEKEPDKENENEIENASNKEKDQEVAEIKVEKFVEVVMDSPKMVKKEKMTPKKLAKAEDDDDDEEDTFTFEIKPEEQLQLTKIIRMLQVKMFASIQMERHFVLETYETVRKNLKILQHEDNEEIMKTNEATLLKTSDLFDEKLINCIGEFNYLLNKLSNLTKENVFDFILGEMTIKGEQIGVKVENETRFLDKIFHDYGELETGQLGLSNQFKRYYERKLRPGTSNVVIQLRNHQVCIQEIQIKDKKTDGGTPTKRKAVEYQEAQNGEFVEPPSKQQVTERPKNDAQTPTSSHIQCVSLDKLREPPKDGITSQISKPQCSPRQNSLLRELISNSSHKPPTTMRNVEQHGGSPMRANLMPNTPPVSPILQPSSPYLQYNQNYESSFTPPITPEIRQQIQKNLHSRRSQTVTTKSNLIPQNDQMDTNNSNILNEINYNGEVEKMVQEIQQSCASQGTQVPHNFTHQTQSHTQHVDLQNYRHLNFQQNNGCNQNNAQNAPVPQSSAGQSNQVPQKYAQKNYQTQRNTQNFAQNSQVPQSPNNNEQVPQNFGYQNVQPNVSIQQNSPRVQQRAQSFHQNTQIRNTQVPQSPSQSGQISQSFGYQQNNPRSQYRPQNTQVPQITISNAQVPQSPSQSGRIPQNYGYQTNVENQQNIPQYQYGLQNTQVPQIPVNNAQIPQNPIQKEFTYGNASIPNNNQHIHPQNNLVPQIPSHMPTSNLGAQNFQRPNVSQICNQSGKTVPNQTMQSNSHNMPIQQNRLQINQQAQHPAIQANVQKQQESYSQIQPNVVNKIPRQRNNKVAEQNCIQNTQMQQVPRHNSNQDPSIQQNMALNSQQQRYYQQQGQKTQVPAQPILLPVQFNFVQNTEMPQYIQTPQNPQMMSSVENMPNSSQMLQNRGQATAFNVQNNQAVHNLQNGTNTANVRAQNVEGLENDSSSVAVQPNSTRHNEKLPEYSSQSEIEPNSSLENKSTNTTVNPNSQNNHEESPQNDNPAKELTEFLRFISLEIGLEDSQISKNTEKPSQNEKTIEDKLTVDPQTDLNEKPTEKTSDKSFENEPAKTTVAPQSNLNENCSQNNEKPPEYKRAGSLSLDMVQIPCKQPNLEENLQENCSKINEKSPEKENNSTDKIGNQINHKPIPTESLGMEQNYRIKLEEPDYDELTSISLALAEAYWIKIEDKSDKKQKIDTENEAEETCEMPEKSIKIEEIDEQMPENEESGKNDTLASKSKENKSKNDTIAKEKEAKNDTFSSKSKEKETKNDPLASKSKEKNDTLATKSKEKEAKNDTLASKSKEKEAKNDTLARKSKEKESKNDTEKVSHKSKETSSRKNKDQSSKKDKKSKQNSKNKDKKKSDKRQKSEHDIVSNIISEMKQNEIKKFKRILPSMPVIESANQKTDSSKNKNQDKSFRSPSKSLGGSSPLVQASPTQNRQRRESERIKSPSKSPGGSSPVVQSSPTQNRQRRESGRFKSPSKSPGGSSSVVQGSPTQKKRRRENGRFKSPSQSPVRSSPVVQGSSPCLKIRKRRREISSSRSQSSEDNSSVDQDSLPFQNIRKQERKDYKSLSQNSGDSSSPVIMKSPSQKEKRLRNSYRSPSQTPGDSSPMVPDSPSQSEAKKKITPEEYQKKQAVTKTINMPKTPVIYVPKILTLTEYVLDLKNKESFMRAKSCWACKKSPVEYICRPCGGRYCSLDCVTNDLESNDHILRHRQPWSKPQMSDIKTVKEHCEHHMKKIYKCCET